MKKPDSDLQKLLSSKLDAEGFDMVDLIPIPSKGDRMVRVRTLEDALDDFDAPGSDDAIGYLIQVRPKSRTAAARTKTDEAAMDLAFFDIQGTGSERQILARPTGETFARAQDPSETLYVEAGKLNIPYLLRNADLLFSSGEFGLARNVYRAVLQAGERSGTAHYWLGRCFEAENEFEYARKSYEESIAFDPTLDAYQRFAALLIRGRKDQEAAEALERALNLSEIHPCAKFELHKAAGNCWMRAESPEKAQAHYVLALAIDPASDCMQANLGALHLQAGNIAEARRRFEAALGVNPRNDKALAGLGSCALTEGDKRGAHDLFARALASNLNNPTAIYYLVKCAYDIKSYATAARIVAEYVDVAPVNTHLLYSLAGLQYHLGRLEAAHASVEKILNLQPEHTGAKELLGLISRY